jgi:hypothetical protein
LNVVEEAEELAAEMSMMIDAGFDNGPKTIQTDNDEDKPNNYDTNHRAITTHDTLVEMPLNKGKGDDSYPDDIDLDNLWDEGIRNAFK